jgi:hypothetical protein
MEPYCSVQRAAGRHCERAPGAGARQRPGGRGRARQHRPVGEVHQGQPGSLHCQGLQKGEYWYPISPLMNGIPVMKCVLDLKLVWILLCAAKSFWFLQCCGA